MPRLYGLFALIDLALLVIALIDCLSVEEFAIRALPRVFWVLLILLFSPIGPIAWFVAGRPAPAQRMSNGETWRPGGGFPESTRPTARRRTSAPDDDPEFLSGLSATSTGDSEMMRKWEADLRRREEELRRRQGDEPQ